MIGPLRFQWRDGVMRPRNPAVAAEQFVEDETYTLVEYEPVSAESRGHYFATIKEAWLNLPEAYDGQFRTSEHLRKWALIEVGLYEERNIVCANVNAARRVASFVRPLDEFAVVMVRGPVVRVYTAQSQSARAMGSKVFQESKQKVLDLLASMVGVPAAELAQNAGRAA